MAVSEAHKRSRDKWLKEKVEDVKFRVPIGKKAIIHAHAESMGESVNAFISRAVDEAMARDKER